MIKSMILRGLKVTAKDNPLSVLVRHFTNVKLSDQPIKYCNIKKLEVNQELSRQVLDRRDHLDLCVDYILKEDIQVPELTLMLNKPLYVVGGGYRKKYQIPDEVKISRWSPIDYNLVKKNMDVLVTAIGQKENKNEVIENIFSPKTKLAYKWPKWHKEKTNVIGCFLGQELPDLRLPCEIFHRAGTLLNQKNEKLATRRIVFTESDDKKIIEYMKNKTESDKSPWSSLSKILGYPSRNIHQRYTQHLQLGGKVVTGKFTSEESRKIMETFFKENENALNDHYASSDPVWYKLGSKLNRSPYNLYQHWEEVIRPQILMYHNGRHHVDFRPILIDYFIENGILFRSETNWSEIVKDKRFKGTTPSYLSRIYSHLVFAVKRTNPGIKDDDITSEVLREYLNKRSRSRIKDYSRLIQDYLAIKNNL